MAKETKITLPLSADLLEKLANFQGNFSLSLMLLYIF